MNVTKNQIDDLNIELTINVAADDYAPVKKEKLKERKKTAEFKGFRKGMVPMALIEKVYGDQAMGDAVNDIVSKALNGFIEENKLNVIGEPLTSENQPEIDWADGNDLEFKFDIATAPELNFELSADDKITYYKIKSSAEAKEEMKKNMLMQYGELQHVEKPGETSYVYVDLEQEGREKVENTFISMRDVTEAMKPAMLGVKAGDKLVININELLEREGDRATLIHVKKETLAEINPEFNATVVEIKDFCAAEANQETFDKIFGEGVITSEDAFEKEIAKRLADNYKQESDFRFGKDAKDYLIAKADIKLPEAFLKRWLKAINKDKFTDEQIDAEFDAFLVDYRWQMIRDYLMNKYELKVEAAEIEDAAYAYVQYQYAMYGMSGVPEQFIKDSAKKILEDRRQVSNLAENVADQKLIEKIRENVTLADKQISVEKFRELK